MECKHGTHEPCDLCAEEDAEHDREMAIQARIDAAVATERERWTADVCNALAMLRSGDADLAGRMLAELVRA